MEIKVLGTGCAKCRSLEKAVNEAVGIAGVDAAVVKEEDIMNIMEYGVMAMPALVIDEKVVIKGRVPSVDEITKLVSK